MDHLIGQRFSLISKSEIRYVGTLHEINAEDSTIALEDVYSFGTEDRPVENFMPPLPQRFEYIVFKGKDVKDIKIEEEQEQRRPEPPQPPNDPAILNSSRPGQQVPQGPTPSHGQPQFPPPGYPPQSQFGGFHPPPGQFGRGYGPPPPPPGVLGPGPGPNFGPYGPPPPGYYGPPGQGFPQGPNRFPHPPPAPIGPPGQRQQPPSQQAPPMAPAAQATAPKQTPELPSKEIEQKKGPAPAQTTRPAPSNTVTSADASKPPPPPPSTTLPTAIQPPPQPASRGPSVQSKGSRTTPAMPFTVNQKSFVPPVAQPQDTSNGTSTKSVQQSKSDMEEASRQAKEAVAAAMAQLQPQNAAAPVPVPQTAHIESLVQKVNQLSTAPAPTSRGRGGHRGQRGQRQVSGGQRQKMDIPQSDFDFESANAKFNKEDLVKEAIASGSPLAEYTEDPVSSHALGQNGVGPIRKDSLPITAVPAYRKSSSFFDDISSDAKDREEEKDARANARTLRGQEFKKNVETFGQGNIDGSYRGRGRGGQRGRGRGNYTNNGGYRGRGRGGFNDVPPTGTGQD